MAVFTRVALTAFPGIVPQWQQIIVFVAIASMALGSFAAIGQKNIKRLMAYSSIGHMGFALVGLAAGTVEGAQGVLVYITIYVAMTLGSFAVILSMKRNGQPMEQISDFAGLSRTNPLLAFVFAMLLFSLAGIPPLAGFFAKWYVFVAAIKAGLFTLAVIGVLTSVVGAFYYLTIIKVMYFDEPAGQIEPMRSNCAPCWPLQVSSTSSSSSIRGRWSASPRPRRSRCFRVYDPEKRPPVFGEDHAQKLEMTFSLGPKAISAGYGLAAFDRTGSTNAEAMSRARDGERGPMWFVTTEQTAGRGRRQRAWIAPRGNLASSVLEVMDVSPGVAATLGFAAGLSLESAVQKLSIEANLRRAGAAPLKYALKWPNDVMAERQKLTGILLEAEAVAGNRLAVVVGIGTNVVAAPEGTPTPATSLAALGVNVGAEELFAALSDAWVEFRGIWDDGRGFAEIRRLWLERAFGLGEPVAIQTGTETVEGMFDTIDETGCLIVRTAEGKRIPIAAGEVYFGAAASVGAA